MRPPPHELAEIFPEMSVEDFNGLKADIAKNGLREPIWLYGGKVIDGRHRLRACDELGIGYSTREYEGDDPVSFVISANLNRRHLSESQRAMVAAGLAKLSHGGDRRSDQAANLPLATTQGVASKLLNISSRLVRDAKVIDKESPGLAKEVKEGKKTVHAAKRELDAQKGKVATDRKVSRPNAEHDEFSPNLADELQHADKEIRNLHALVESLKKSDLAKEVAAWHLKFDQLEGRLHQCMTTKAEAERQAKYSTKLLADIRSALGVQKNAEILPALKARRRAA